MPKIGRKVKIFSALEVANICGVVNQTAINWIKNGYLKAFTTPGGQYRIYAKDLAAFLDNRGMVDSGEALQGLLERSNSHIFMIAVSDVALNNRLKDGLLNVFPDLTIIQANDGFDMGFRLSGEKPGFILIEQELPGVDHKKLLHFLKADPVFGKPVIIAIGSGGNKLYEEAADRIMPNPPDLAALINLIKDIDRQTEAIA